MCETLVYRNVFTLCNFDLNDLSSSQGLNFSIHADAAWGAYFACMLKDPKDNESLKNVQEEAFVPELSLNTHVTKQLQVHNLHYLDYFSEAVINRGR